MFLNFSRCYTISYKENLKGTHKSYLERLTLQLKAAGIETVATIINYDLPNNYYTFTNPNNVGWLGDKIQIALENSPYLDTLIAFLGQNVDRWVTFESIGQEIIYGYGDKNYPPSRFDYAQSTSHIFTAAHNIMKAHKFIYEKFKNEGIQNVGIGIEGLEYSQPADPENQKGFGFKIYGNSLRFSSGT